MERQTGSTRLTGSPGGQGGDDELLRAVKEAAAAEYEILGEMGRGERGSVVYLARERASQKLAALKLRPDGSEFELSVVRELDASVPAMGNKCPSCKVDLVGWGRFCSNCGKDLSGTRSGEASQEELLKAVQSAAEGEYEVLGEMQRSEGGGVVYFARELKSGRLVALRLTREQESDGSESYALGVTQVIKPLVASLGATYASPTSVMQAATAPPSRAAAPSSRSPQPTAKSVTPPSVMVPDDAVEEEGEPRPKKRAPIIPIAVIGALLLVGGGLFIFSDMKHGAPDATQGPAANVVTPAAPPAVPPPVAATPDSGTISIGSLPAGAHVTLNGKAVTDRQLSLLPGKYQLVASAPGFKTESQRVEVVAGQSSSFAPTMQSATVAAARAPVAPPVTTPVVPRPAAAPNCLNAYSDKQYAAALLACTREANAGNQQAQRNLAVIYDQGLGVNQDPAQAAIWFKKAAQTGNRDATFQLASMYEQGRGVPKDPKQALDWYRKAALLGDADSQVKLGRAYLSGDGVDKDEGEASAWFQRAADQGNLYALNRLGAMYIDGKGVHKDEARGVKLFQAAVAKGDAQGEFNLAAMYAKGHGVAKSDSAANDLYVKSAKQGYADAIKEAKKRNLKF
ncbi:MAG: PEGA domain-containing protein [Gemmatimonadota bacterium]|nr:PEGA domain-containing protein [Gemmatimonadota bacterium]